MSSKAITHKDILGDYAYNLIESAFYCFGTGSLMEEKELLSKLRKKTDYKDLTEEDLINTLSKYKGIIKRYPHNNQFIWRKVKNIPKLESIAQEVQTIIGGRDRVAADINIENFDFESLKISPYKWQKEALLRWSDAKCRGVVEAVTGTGKTFLGLCAWELLDKQLNKPLHCMIVVPSIPIMEQWISKLVAFYPEEKIARQGAGYKDTFAKGKIMVAVINSVREKLPKLMESNLKGTSHSLLIADECHRYIKAPVNGKIREHKWDSVLALSATVDEPDVPGLGEKLFTYTFSEAAKEGVIAKFRILNISTTLNFNERKDYDDLTDRINDQLKIIMNKFPEEFGQTDSHNINIGNNEFFTILNRLSKGNDDEDPVIVKYYGLVFRRESIMHQCANKLNLANKIIDLLLVSKRKVIGFYERIENSEDARIKVDVPNPDQELANRLTNNFIHNNNSWCEVYHSGLSKKERESVLDDFSLASSGLLLTCRALDEGYDVPDIDVALLVSSTKNKRQRIQRVGRAIRAKEGKESLIISLHVENTTDVKTMYDDKGLFGDAAEIESCTASDALSRIKYLLTNTST